MIELSDSSLILTPKTNKDFSSEMISTGEIQNLFGSSTRKVSFVPSNILVEPQKIEKKRYVNESSHSVIICENSISEEEKL